MISSISLRHMRAFVAVADHGSFTAAAQKLGVTGPSLTTTIRQFEDLAGAGLFDRTTRQVALSATGLRFLPIARRLIGDFEDALGDLDALSKGIGGTIRIAAAPSVLTRILPGIVSRFVGEHPDARLRLDERNAGEVHEAVANNEADFGIAGEWHDLPDIAFVPLFSDRFGVLCRENHEFAGRKEIGWSELAGQALVGLGPESGTRAMMSAQGSWRGGAGAGIGASAGAEVGAGAGGGAGVGGRASVGADADAGREDYRATGRTGGVGRLAGHGDNVEHEAGGGFGMGSGMGPGNGMHDDSGDGDGGGNLPDMADFTPSDAVRHAAALGIPGAQKLLRTADASRRAIERVAKMAANADVRKTGRRKRGNADHMDHAGAMTDPVGQLRPIVETSNTITLAAMVAEGVGITVLPELAARVAELAAPGKLVFVPLCEPVRKRPIGIITRQSRSLSPIAQIFLAMVIEQAPQMDLPAAIEWG